ncbi:MFS transporter [Streptomyces albidoflavus]
MDSNPKVQPIVLPRDLAPRAALTLGPVLLGCLVVPMAMSGTSAALPRIAAGLGGGGGALQWVVTGYFLAASSLMLVAGALGDRYGRRRVFAAGAALYALSAFGAALAPQLLALNVARTLSGVGAAGVMACGGAVLAGAFEGPARTRAFALVGTAVGVGLAFGPTFGGWLVTALGWRAMFAAFGAAGVLLVVGAGFMAESRAARRTPFDLPGAAAFVLGAVGLMYGTNQAATYGWSSPRVLGWFGAGLLLLALFAARQRRTAYPLLDLGLLRGGPFAGWLLAALTAAVGTAGLLVHLPAYLQGAGGLSAGDAGTVLLALTLPVLAVPPLAGRLVNAGASPRLLILLGLGLVAAGNAWLTVLAPDSGAAVLTGPLLCVGAGNGLAAALVDAQAMAHVPPGRVGMAAGLLNTVRGGANALVLAVFGAALISLMAPSAGGREVAGRVAAGDLGDGPREALAEAYTAAWHSVLWAVAGLCAAAALAVHLLTRTRTRSRTGPAGGGAAT